MGPFCRARNMVRGIDRNTDRKLDDLPLVGYSGRVQHLISVAPHRIRRREERKLPIAQDSMLYDLADLSASALAP